MLSFDRLASILWVSFHIEAPRRCMMMAIQHQSFLNRENVRMCTESLLFAIVLSLVTGLLADESAATAPNILIIYADDLGFGDLSCQNPDSKIPTPNLDALAQQSMRFTDGHSSSAICSPSRYALLTGRYHWRKFHGIVGVFGPSVFAGQRLTMPEMLRSKGYSTAAIGKWHLGWDWEAIHRPNAQPITQGKQPVWPVEAFDWSRSIPDGPLAHGFDHYFGDTVINFPPYCWIEDDRVTETPDAMLDTTRWKAIKVKEGQWECRPGPMISDWGPVREPADADLASRRIRSQSGERKRTVLPLLCLALSARSDHSQR